MITKQVIDRLYKTYNRRPEGVEDLDIGLLFEYASEHHDLTIDGDGNIVISSVEPDSPFRKIALTRLHAIVEFENYVALVMHSSIVFLHKHSNKVDVHLRLEEPSLWERVKIKLG